MTFGPCIALGQKFGGHFGDNVTVFGMHHRNTAKFGQTVERCEQLIIIHHQRAFIGEEVFERVDTALFNDCFHVVENLFAPPCDRHVEGIVTIRACGFVVPPFDRVHQAFALVRQTEINDHRCTTGQAGARAAFEIVAGIGAHERHFEVHMRVNPARHDITAGGIKDFVTRQTLADLGDHTVFNQNIRLIGEVGGDDGTVFDNCAHSCFPHSTIWAVSRTACSNTSVPAAAHSGLISSASLCESPSTQGHIIIAVGATSLTQQASCPAPDTMSR